MVNNAFTRNIGTPVSQLEQENSRQVKNNAGGYTFEVDDKARLQRFLILGTDGGTYYASEKQLTKDNTAFLRELIERNEQLVMETVLDVSTNGRSFRNSAAIFTVACLFHYGTMKYSSVLRKVCRTATHVFEFAEYIQLLGGWGRSKRRAVAEWYTDKNVNDLAYQAIKYRQRNGWTHRDMIRLSHPVGIDNKLGAFILGKDNRTAAETHDLPKIIEGFRFAQEAETASEIINFVLNDYPNLPWEAIPTKFHKDPQVWKKIFYNGALQGQALLRNITRLARIGAFDDMVFAGDYAAKLVDKEMIKRTKLHPYQYLVAQTVHSTGQWSHGLRVSDWSTNSTIIDALNAGFYAAFEYVEPAKKRTMIALDVSSSMHWASSGVDLTAAQVGAAMAMTIAKTEPYYQIMGFSSQLVDLDISPGMGLSDILRKTRYMTFGSTDCALPMLHALKKNIAVDTFIVITDNETWDGNVHPHVALQQYRKATGIDAKLIVVGVTATNFTIADPTDRGMLDVVGGDSNLPKLITEFSAGRI